MALEAKTIKEEIPDKDLYVETQRRLKVSSKDRCKTPDSPEGARLVAPRSPVSPQQHMGGPPLPPARHSNGSASPHLNGSMGSLTPPLPTPGVTPLVVDPPQSFGTPGSSQRPLVKVKRFLSTLVTFGQDISPEIGDRVRSLVLSLVSTGLGIEEFQHSLQEVTNFPLRPFVLPFLRAHLPLLQREVQSLARVSKQTPLQYVYAHDHVVLDPAHSPAEAADIFLPNDTLTTPGSVLKRRASDTFHDGQTNGVSHSEMGGDFSPPKRPHPSLLLNPSPLLLPLHQHQSLFEYPNYPTYQSVGNHELPSQERRELSTGNLHLNYDHGRSGGSSDRRNDDEWKNINTMLNCILSMVEKTKRALSILQTRGNPPDTSAAVENGDIRRLVNEILAATVRQTEERVAEVKRRAEDAVNQVKRQAVLELQRAVSHAETKAVELVAVERAKMEKIMTAHKQNVDESRSENHDNSNSPPAPTAPQQNACWNCGRKANETCSGCNVARYCGSFCQHRDWETRHHQSCGSTDAVSKTASRILPVQPNVSAANTNCGNTLSISTVNAKCSILPSGTTSAANSTISSNIAGERIPPLKK